METFCYKLIVVFLGGPGGDPALHVLGELPGRLQSGTPAPPGDHLPHERLHQV